MITVERLKELIKEKGVVYTISSGIKYKIQLGRDEILTKFFNCDTLFTDMCPPMCLHTGIFLNDIFEEEQECINRETVCNKLGLDEKFLTQMIDVGMMEHIRLEQENKILRRALELACKTYYEDCGEEDCPCGESESFDNSYDGCRYCEAQDGHSEINKNGKCWYNYFIDQAKKEMEND